MSVPRVVHETDYCRIVLRDSPRTIISFSEANVPAGGFGGSRIFEDADCNVVCLNCPDNSWYLEGVPGLGTCPESTVAALLALLADLGLTHDRRVTWGSSMGGYGAVVYGALLGVDVIVVSGAVLKLFEPGSLSLEYFKNSRRRENLSPPDVRGLVENAPGRFSCIWASIVIRTSRRRASSWIFPT